MFNIKKFEDVKVGDVAIDHTDEEYIVLAKARNWEYDKVEKYDVSGMMAETLDWDDQCDMVALLVPSIGHAVCCYGVDGGVWVEDRVTVPGQ